jgi:hypothetical protein
VNNNYNLTDMSLPEPVDSIENFKRFEPLIQEYADEIRKQAKDKALKDQGND